MTGGVLARTLAQKLGFKPGLRACIFGAPDTMALDIPVSDSGPFAFQIHFARSRADVTRIAEGAARRYETGAVFWIAFPKKSGAIKSDLTRDEGWAPLTSQDFLPVSNVALDADWSALRFRKRAEIPKLTRKSVSSGGTE